MVEKSTLSRKIDVRLRSIRDHLNALDWYGERFGAVTSRDNGADWDALEAEWRDTLDRFEGAHAWYLAGDMSNEQAERHRGNLALLATHVPVIRQLGLRLPSEVLASSREGSAAPGA
jgi:hypothetical protein